jgi:hypothetical protein
MKTSDTVSARFEAKFIPEPNTGCWLWFGCGHVLGYGLFRHERKTKKAHRVSWELHRGAIPEGGHVCHLCDVRGCVNPEHLFIGTHNDNMTDMSRKGRGRTDDKRGSLNPNAVLVDAQVREIRRLRDAGWSQRKIAETFEVSVMTVNRIVNGEAWTHVV